jgi:hypothetical protein
MRTAARRERGAGLVSTFAGLLVVLVLLLFAVDVLVGLYTGTSLSGATHAAARQVASDQRVRDGSDQQAAVRDGDAELRDLLGGVGRNADVRWAVDGDEVEVAARVRRPGILPAGWRATGREAWIERTVHVRVEALR